jgi:hypothetical protein
LTLFVSITLGQVPLVVAIDNGDEADAGGSDCPDDQPEDDEDALEDEEGDPVVGVMLAVDGDEVIDQATDCEDALP